MHFSSVPQRIRTLSVATFVVVGMLLFVTPTHAGLDDNVHGWAWSGTTGWISLNCTDTAYGCGVSNYGVNIRITAGYGDRADIYGWAWSETVGWICFGYSCSGTTPDGQSPYAQYRMVVNGKNDEFIGWAQIQSMGDEGWISLNCENMSECASSNYRVILDNLTGTFTRGAPYDSFAWGANDNGTGIGWVDFRNVTTTWTMARIGLLRRPQGIFEPQPPKRCSGDGSTLCTIDADCSLVGGPCVMPTLPGTHLYTFGIGFVDFSAPKDFVLQCEVKLPNGSIMSIRKTMADTVRDISTCDMGPPDPDFACLDYTLTQSDIIDNNRPWIIQHCSIMTPLNATACASDAPCLPDGICDIAGGFCRTVIDDTGKKRPIFTHTNDWTGLGADEDWYSAIKCSAGFPDQYFKNATRCDFTGDATFALAMRRGVPLEGICDDGIDNDGNGQIDCADRYCKGLSYLCQSHQPTRCIWGFAGDGLMDCTDLSYVTGDLCCSKQPISSTMPDANHIVDGLECEYGDPVDGYFDCTCTTTAAFNADPGDDCFAPGYTSGDLCCDLSGEVVRQ